MRNKEMKGKTARLYAAGNIPPPCVLCVCRQGVSPAQPGGIPKGAGGGNGKWGTRSVGAPPKRAPKGLDRVERNLRGALQPPGERLLQGSLLGQFPPQPQELARPSEGLRGDRPVQEHSHHLIAGLFLGILVQAGVALVLRGHGLRPLRPVVGRQRLPRLARHGSAPSLAWGRHGVWQQLTASRPGRPHAPFSPAFGAPGAGRRRPVAAPRRQHGREDGAEKAPAQAPLLAVAKPGHGASGPPSAPWRSGPACSATSGKPGSLSLRSA